jgi:hypothetical protein
MSSIENLVSDFMHSLMDDGSDLSAIQYFDSEVSYEEVRRKKMLSMWESAESGSANRGTGSFMSLLTPCECVFV